jgi:endonuclease/exonuclease/phosphatase family metal-dependent hydrolase
MSRFRVLQFNMQFGQHWDERDPDGAPVNLDATVAEIRSHAADVVFLQEVERARPGGEQVEPPPNYTRLRKALPDYHGVFAYPRPDPRELPFGLGLAILSRAPLVASWREDLPSPPVEFEFAGRVTTPTDRVALGARTLLGGRELRVINTHLLAFFMLKSSSEAHPEQRQRLVDLLQREEGPTLLAGDFNVSDTASLTAQLSTAGFATVQDHTVTWRRRPYVLDHIFHNAPLRCVEWAVLPTPTSDHHLLRAEFEWTAL